MQLHIQVENIKCAGCTKSITNQLQAIPNVQQVIVNKETQTISLQYVNYLNTQEVKEKLAAMGYPEKGNNNLLHKAKSFVSCAVGKIS